MPAPDMNRAKVGKKKGEPKFKLNKGRHVCEIFDMRYEDTRGYGLAFFLDFDVRRGPTPVGSRSTFEKYPDSVRPNGSDFTLEELKDREIGKIQVAIAAAAGFPADARHNVTNEYAARATAYPRNKANPGQKSPFAGHLIIVDAVESKNGKIYYEILPYSEEAAADITEVIQPDAAPAAESSAPPPAARVGVPQLPPKAAAVFPPAPWKIHPENDEYVYREDTGAFMTVAELKQTLGL